MPRWTSWAIAALAVLTALALVAREAGLIGPRRGPPAVTASGPTPGELRERAVAELRRAEEAAAAAAEAARQAAERALAEAAERATAEAAAREAEQKVAAERLAALQQPPETPDVLPEGEDREEVFALCTACHSSAVVRRTRLSRERWDELMDWMVDRHGMNPMDGEQRTRVVDYLAKNFAPQRGGSRGANPFATD